jgi:hypothetical protein
VTIRGATVRDDVPDAVPAALVNRAAGLGVPGVPKLTPVAVGAVAMPAAGAAGRCRPVVRRPATIRHPAGAAGAGATTTTGAA